MPQGSHRFNRWQGKSGKEKQATVYVPGGDNKYPGFWVRDAVMQCTAGIIPVTEMSTMLDIILTQQNGEKARELENGMRILLDFHYPEWDERIAAKANVEEIVSNFVRGNS